MLFTDLSSERVVRALQKAGFFIVTQGKHIGISNGKIKLIIPHSKRINPYTLKGIIREAGISDDEFRTLL